MQSETKEFISEIRNSEFFQNCGTLDRDSCNDILAISSRSKAINSLCTLKWDHFNNSIHNRSRQKYFTQTSYTESQRNSLNDEIISEVWEAFEKSILANYGDLFEGPKKDIATNAIKGDFVSIAFELELDSFYPPIFYVPVLLPWYRKGHLPCGWDGEKIKETEWQGDSPADLPPGRLKVW